MSILWLDLETTGLNPLHDRILEVGVVISTDTMRALMDRSWVMGASNETLANVSKVVKDMHTANGLWSEVLTSKLTIEEAEEELLGLLDYFQFDEMITVGGSGVSRFDIPFIAERMPNLAARIHFRHLDVSPIKEFARRVGTWDAFDAQLRSTGRVLTHRAVDDAEHARAVAERMYTLMKSL